MTEENIKHIIGGKIIGNQSTKNFVYKTLGVFPDDIALFIAQNCWFMSSMDDAYAYAFTGNDLKNQHLIFLSDDLFHQSNNQIYFTIAHEIGHIILGHRNSVHYKQSKEEIFRQEKEADTFAHQHGFVV